MTNALLGIASLTALFAIAYTFASTALPSNIINSFSAAGQLLGNADRFLPVHEFSSTIGFVLTIIGVMVAYSLLWKLLSVFSK